MIELERDRLVYRAMTLMDVPEILEIEQEAFSCPWTEEAFRNELINNHFARYMVIVHDGRIIGYGGMWVIIDEAHITNIAIRGDYRGKGIGESLLTEMQKLAIYFGAVRMTLEVRASNEVAKGLYRKLGFEEAGVRPGYYSDNQEDALIMWAELSIPGAGSSYDDEE